MLLVDPRQVEIVVDGGVVTLSGQLDTRADAQLAARFVERLEGVVAVVDRLTYRYDKRLADTKTAPLTPPVSPYRARRRPHPPRRQRRHRWTMSDARQPAPAPRADGRPVRALLLDGTSSGCASWTRPTRRS